MHAGPRALGWDETTRRAWMGKTVGKRSAKDCGEAELIHLVEALRVAGFRPAPPVKRPGGAGMDRPSDGQWGLIAKLARQKGFSGLDDPALATLARRVAKVDSLRFLDQLGARALILALERWLAPERNGAGQAADLPRHLTQPKAVLLDASKPDFPAVLMVYDMPGQPYKLVVEMDYRVKDAGHKVTANILRSGRIVPEYALRGYDVLEGAL